MRLIDADEYIKEMCSGCDMREQCCADNYCGFIMTIKNAPTVDAIPSDGEQRKDTK